MGPCSWESKHNCLEQYSALLSLSSSTGAEAAFSCSQCQDLLDLCCPLTVVWEWRMEKMSAGVASNSGSKAICQNSHSRELESRYMLAGEGRVQRADWWEVPNTCLRMGLSWVLEWAASVSFRLLWAVLALWLRPPRRSQVSFGSHLCLRAPTWSTRKITPCRCGVSKEKALLTLRHSHISFLS